MVMHLLRRCMIFSARFLFRFEFPSYSSVWVFLKTRLWSSSMEDMALRILWLQTLTSHDPKNPKNYLLLLK